MPHCSQDGCKKIAYYGTIFEKPVRCKDHADIGMTTVKKKCAMCNNAAKDEHCSRCASAIYDISKYRDMRMRELSAQIDAELTNSMKNIDIADRPKTPRRVVKKGGPPPPGGKGIASIETD